MFKLGRIVGTPAALAALTDKEVTDILIRHAKWDWGEVSEEDKKKNDFSARNEYRICSVYTTRGMKINVITEADRSATTIAFPDEYYIESGASSIEDLKNEFSLIHRLYENEEDLKVKDVFRKQILEIAMEVGKIVLQDQIT